MGSSQKPPPAGATDSPYGDGRSALADFAIREGQDALDRGDRQLARVYKRLFNGIQRGEHKAIKATTSVLGVIVARDREHLEQRHRRDTAARSLVTTHGRTSAAQAGRTGTRSRERRSACSRRTAKAAASGDGSGSTGDPPGAHAPAAEALLPHVERFHSRLAARVAALAGPDADLTFARLSAVLGAIAPSLPPSGHLLVFERLPDDLRSAAWDNLAAELERQREQEGDR